MGRKACKRDDVQPEFQEDAKWDRHRIEPPEKDLLIETVVTALTPDRISGGSWITKPGPKPGHNGS